MKRAAMVVALMTWALPLAAQNISNSPHNLSTSGQAAGNTIYAQTETQICVFCHFPHSTGNPTYLWNHAATVATYTFYTSSTMNAVTPTALSGSSLYCMSCHDGTVAVGDVVLPPKGGTDPIAMVGVEPTTGAIPTTSPARLGTDLSDDHPVSIQYEDGQFSATPGNADPGLRTRTNPNEVTNGTITLHLEGEKVQCGTCHNPHDNTNAPFLEVSNTGSQLCLTCHLK